MSAWNEGPRKLSNSDKTFTQCCHRVVAHRNIQQKFPLIYALKQTYFRPWRLKDQTLHCQVITKFGEVSWETMMFRSNAAFKISAWNEDPKIEGTAHIFKHAIELRNSRSFSPLFLFAWEKFGERKMCGKWSECSSKPFLAPISVHYLRTSTITTKA